ncbi:unnamed protein product [Leptidea sinapis]|uniref:SOCS box domain-containing protein n=1 Tax=Leptidea sinapis TaxID=189913 RepID=A0A5E4PVX4_9NEOP|nr:unnamed protein product [Leptidea sinapis]
MFGTTGMVRSPQQATGQVAQNGSTTFPRSHHQRTGRPPAAPKSYDYLLKVLLVGDSDVGKQEILQDLEDGSADSPFCSGSAYKTTTILLDGKRVKLQLWDTSGQGRFCTIIRSYSRGAQGILLVYDITNKWSFDSIDRWLEEVEKHAPGVPKVLVGNRLHLAFKRQVQERDAELYAAKNHMAFFEKKCNKMMLRLNNFLYVFNLRQGTILIAVHQIALSSFFLIVLLVGISHLGEMLQLLHNDMKDEEERRGFYGVGYGDHVKFHESDVISTNNQLRYGRFSLYQYDIDNNLSDLFYFTSARGCEV